VIKELYNGANSSVWKSKSRLSEGMRKFRLW